MGAKKSRKSKKYNKSKRIRKTASSKRRRYGSAGSRKYAF